VCVTHGETALEDVEQLLAALEAKA